MLHPLLCTPAPPHHVPPAPAPSAPAQPAARLFRQAAARRDLEAAAQAAPRPGPGARLDGAPG
eukprot:scaffold42983_cov48-Phaeocystis_antarctica.AAC.1